VKPIFTSDFGGMIPLRGSNLADILSVSILSSHENYAGRLP
jgi:hypothetical protein